MFVCFVHDAMHLVIYHMIIYPRLDVVPVIIMGISRSIASIADLNVRSIVSNQNLPIPPPQISLLSLPTPLHPLTLAPYLIYPTVAQIPSSLHLPAPTPHQPWLPTLATPTPTSPSALTSSLHAFTVVIVATISLVVAICWFVMIRQSPPSSRLSSRNNIKELWTSL
jgi:hypothetical protein